MGCLFRHRGSRISRSEVKTGLTVQFAEEASVASPMPETHAEGAAQQIRWDTGNALLARRFAARLIGRGVSRRSPNALHTGIELLVPAICPGSYEYVHGRCGGRPAPTGITHGRLHRGGQATYVLGALRLVGAPPKVFRALWRSPALLVRRLAQNALVIRGREAARGCGRIALTAESTAPTVLTQRHGPSGVRTSTPDASP